MKIYLSAIGLCFSVLFTQAQIFKKTDQFTKQDTLRGSITPERAWWDVVMYDLQVKPDFTRFTLSGTNTIYFKIVKSPAAKMQIDLQEPLTIDSAWLNDIAVTFSREGNAWFIDLPKGKMPKSLPQNQYKNGPLQQLKLVYHGVPKPAFNAPWDGGVVWKKDEKGNPWINVA